MASVTETAPYKGVIAYFPVADARKAAAFYEKAFAGEVVDTRPVEDGRLMHCEMTINGGPVMFNDPFPEHGMGETGAGGCVMTLTVDDVQAWWNRAVDAGCTVVLDLHDAFWGDRYGQLADPFGIRWALVGPKA